ncbi:MAG: ketopantoate reductase family protein [Dehalococcoidia bacterium]|nr:ketopantoate reductase family protein [Dehalococcoidia bacterium]
MRYIIYGAGAVGGIVGAGLFEHGHEVVLIARGSHLAMIQKEGLRAVYPDRETHQEVPAVSHPSQIDFRDGDVVFLTMKTQDTEAALADLEACAGNDLPIFCMQNGVENERLAARRFANVYGVNVLMPASFLEPGTVSVASAPVAGVLDSGRYPSGIDATLEAVAAGLEGSGFKCQPLAEIQRWKNAKLIRNLGNGLQGACGMEFDTSDIRAALEAEARAVFEKAQLPVTPLDEFTARTVFAPPSGGGSSGWQSVMRGTGSIEADFLNGEIVLLGRLHGVPAPYNEAVRRSANRVARERLTPGACTPEEIHALAKQLG